MSEFFIVNDSYNWFDRLDKFENSINNILENSSSKREILTKIETFLLDNNYNIVEEFIEDEIKVLFFNKELDESLIFQIKKELGLDSIILRIVNGEYKYLKDINFNDENNIFFTRFI